MVIQESLTLSRNSKVKTIRYFDSALPIVFSIDTDTIKYHDAETNMQLFIHSASKINSREPALALPAPNRGVTFHVNEIFFDF